MNVTPIDAERDCPNCGNLVLGEFVPPVDLKQPVKVVIQQLCAKHDYVFVCRRCGFTTYWIPEAEVQE